MVKLIFMLRRYVSLVVIVGFLAGQLAVMPHAHGTGSASDQQKHAATPHFHGKWFGHAGHDHGHSHRGYTHSHHRQRNEGRTTPSIDDSRAQLLGVGLSGADHDADAVFLPAQAGPVLRTSHLDQAASAWQLAALAVLPAWLGDCQTRLGIRTPWHPPDEVLDASGSYLILRNLRI
jgi:hypothetical protein